MTRATDPPPPAALNLVVIRSSDLDVSARFYTAVGLTLTKHRHGDGPEHYAAEAGPVVFEIYPRRGAHDLTTFTRLGFRVASADETLARLAALGAPVLSPAADSPWGRRAVVGDPDGHPVEIVQGG